MSKLSVGHILFLVGLLMSGFTFGADLLGLGDGSGIGGYQLVGLVISMILLICGLIMWTTRKDLMLKAIPKADLANLSLGQSLVILGMGLAILALGADIFSIGFDNTVGETQVMGAFVGFILIGGGFFLWGTSRDRPICKFIQRILVRIFGNVDTRLRFIAQMPAKERVTAAILITTLGLGSIFFTNNILPRIDAAASGLKTPTLFHESIYGIGADCKVGIYRQSYMALHHSDLYVEHTKMSDYSNYPPFTHLFFMPLQLLSEENAYRLVVVLLFLTNILVLTMITFILRKVLLPWKTGIASNFQAYGTFLFAGVLFLILTGYPFLFSIERGNYDILAFFFSVLCLYLVVTKPQAMWWQVIALSIATNLKVYPAALFFILLVVHGKKMLLPTLIVNATLLLSLGYTNELKFFEVLFTYSLAPDSWAGNHSGFSFADHLIRLNPGLTRIRSGLEWLFTLLPLIVWVISSLYIIKRYKEETQSILLFMVCIPLMLLFPSTSHDYALVILGAAILIHFTLLFILIYHSRGVWGFVQLLFMLVLLAFIDRSTYLFPPFLQTVSNKYPWVFLLSLLMLGIVIQLNAVITQRRIVEMTAPPDTLENTSSSQVLPRHNSPDTNLPASE